jgi:hypothetical protein
VYTTPTTTTTTSTTTTTTTTTTPAPAVNPEGDCDGVDCNEVCQGITLQFSSDQIVSNTLPGAGYSGGGVMKIINVAPETGDRVDLYITDKKGNFDLSTAKTKSGYRSGSWMSSKTGIYEKDGVELGALRIAMEAATEYEFQFELKNAAGEPVTLREFPLAFYDMDYYEYVEACGAAGTALHIASDLTKTTQNGCVKFSSGYRSAESPSDFDHPTEIQAKASASFIYKDTSSWTMKFGLKWYGHRWVLFKSSKALACE